MKYYWVLYYTVGIQNFKETILLGVHPFTFIKKLNKTPWGTTNGLQNWKEITEEEYHLFNKID